MLGLWLERKQGRHPVRRRTEGGRKERHPIGALVYALPPHGGSAKRFSRSRLTLQHVPVTTIALFAEGIARQIVEEQRNTQRIALEQAARFDQQAE